MNSIYIYLIIISTCSFSVLAKPPNIVLVSDLTTTKTVWKEVRQGVELAVREIEKAKQAINFTAINSGSTVLGTRAAMIEAIRNHKADLVIAEIDSSKAEVAAAIAQKSTVPMVTPFATSPRITKNRPYVFRACISDIEITKRLASYVLKSGITELGIVFDSGQLYSSTLKEEFKKEFESIGGKVVMIRSILNGSNNYKAISEEIVSKKVKALFLPFYEEIVMKFLVKATKVKGFQDIKLIGSDGWASGDFFTKVNSASKMKGLWVSHHNPNANSSLISNFKQKYLKNYGELPKTSAAYLGYDALKIAYKSLIRKTSESNTEKIRSMKTYHGVTGSINFHRSNEPDKPMFIMEYDGNKIFSSGSVK